MGGVGGGRRRRKWRGIWDLRKMGWGGGREEEEEGSGGGSGI